MIIDADPSLTGALATAELDSEESLPFDPRKLDPVAVVHGDVELLCRDWKVVTQFQQGHNFFTVYKIPTPDQSEKFYSEQVEISSQEVVEFYSSDQAGVPV